MQPIKTASRIYIDETMRETLRHGSDAFPFQYYLDDIWNYDLHSVDWHWHPEVEYVYIRSGHAQGFVGADRFSLDPGQGMFINSRVVHHFVAQASTIVPNIVFAPTLLSPEDSLIYRRFIQPMLSRGPAWALLDPGVPWQADALSRLNAVFDLWECDDPSQLETLRLLLELWTLLIQNLPLPPEGADPAESSGSQARLQVMLQYIHDHYGERVTLDDIAGSVYISKSSALQIFQSGIRLSPVAYLIQYRLRQAARLLASTERSVSAIAEETGFQSAGYFCRRFRELFGVTPVEYRKGRKIDL